MPKDAEEDAAFAIAANPTHGVVRVWTRQRARHERHALVHIRLCHIHAQENVQFFARVWWINKAKEFVRIFELLPVERSGQGTVGVVYLYLQNFSVG